MLLEQERKKIIEVALTIQKEKLIPLTFGNFSLRDTSTGYICITPSGMPYETLHPSDIVVVDVNGNIIDGERKPSVEVPMHTAIYRKRKDVNGIIHTHSTYCTAWACRDGGMPCITSEVADLVGGKVKCAKFCLPGSQELADVTAETLGDDKAVLMGNHGAICADVDIDTALKDAIILEAGAKVAFIAFQMGNVNILDDQIAKFMLEDTKQNYGQVENK
ncbi:class II aldolase/adducin family protein [Absicoccus intestinalis]|uniref:Class II aldolase/adducin family protein n=1 Tax=Absicoccus intestinalis TaxID=2926319 RepID=A0ABU4WNL1_9FIRM|nr:class II aldolase/adducin family protein [Absicoccus sp. CLA-KB-P134]MDX8418141.1 class II aldolase/adducin family protein [Absicoccus sp. CLA-KB-P134]